MGPEMVCGCLCSVGRQRGGRSRPPVHGSTAAAALGRPHIGRRTVSACHRPSQALQERCVRPIILRAMPPSTAPCVPPDTFLRACRLPRAAPSAGWPPTRAIRPCSCSCSRWRRSSSRNRTTGEVRLDVASEGAAPAESEPGGGAGGGGSALAAGRRASADQAACARCELPVCRFFLQTFW